MTKESKLSKSIASFANTKGGVILIGVEEGKDTKLPIACEGIKYDPKLSEQINQEIANVEPYPECKLQIICDNDKKTYESVRSNHC